MKSYKRRVRALSDAGPPRSFTDQAPYLFAGISGSIAPWILGGRAVHGLEILGILCWLSFAVGLLCLGLKYKSWRYDNEYAERRGNRLENPLKIFCRELRYALPLIIFIGLCAWGLTNPMIGWQGDTLLLYDYNPQIPLVVDKSRSGPGIFFLSGLITLFILLQNKAFRPSRVWLFRIATILLLNCLILSWVGLFTRYAGNGLILGFIEPKADYFFATYYYKNHWVAYALLHCGIALMFATDALRRPDMMRRSGMPAFYLLALVCIGLSIAIVESRSGILLLGFFFCAALGVNHKHPSLQIPLKYMLIMLLLGAGLFTFLIKDEIIHNWERTQRQIEKQENVIFDPIRTKHGPRIALNMFQDRPTFGWGYLSFSPLFKNYEPENFDADIGKGDWRIEFAHNDWLQGLAEFGLVGTGLLTLGIFLLWRHATPPGKAPRGLTGVDSLYLGLLSVGLFALWDFPFSNPSVLLNSMVIFVWGCQISRISERKS